MCKASAKMATTQNPSTPFARSAMLDPTDLESLPLKEAYLRAAREAISERGVEFLSLREVARRLGVSHQAPYRHFPSRDHLLVEIMRRCFQDFAAFLETRLRHSDPRRDLGSLGARYLTYAADHPVEYRLMFGTPWPAVAEELDLATDARYAFDVLRHVLKRVHSDRSTRRQIDLDALFIWSNMHGHAMLAQSNLMSHLDLTPQVQAATERHLFQRIGAALDAKDGG
jgi:AcrR family transcriptional regulator